METAQPTYLVVVKGNLVCAIEPAAPGSGASGTGTPLEIATALSSNFAATGCIDGQYAFHDAAQAREFAELCLRFSKALLDRRLTAIEGLPHDFSVYRADEQPARGTSS